MEDEDVGKVFDDGRVVGRVDAKGARVKRVTEARRRAGPVHDALRKRRGEGGKRSDGWPSDLRTRGRENRSTHPSPDSIDGVPALESHVEEGDL